MLQSSRKRDSSSCHAWIRLLACGLLMVSASAGGAVASEGGIHRDGATSIDNDATTNAKHHHHSESEIKESDEELKQQKPINFTSAKVLKENQNIRDYLNPKLLAEPDILEDIADELSAGRIVVIRNAFNKKFANATHEALRHLHYEKTEMYNPSGYQHHYHHHVLSSKNHSHHSHHAHKDNKDAKHHHHHQHIDFLHDVSDVFLSDESKAWINYMSDQDSFGHGKVIATEFKPNDYSLPHNRFEGQHTIAWKWILAKPETIVKLTPEELKRRQELAQEEGGGEAFDEEHYYKFHWKNEWGGALYWCPEDHEHAWVHAAFNTLVLFRVSIDTTHMVTTVSNSSQSWNARRLELEGYWESLWDPSDSADVAEKLDAWQGQNNVTAHQWQRIQEIYNSMLQQENETTTKGVDEATKQRRLEMEPHVTALQEWNQRHAEFYMEFEQIGKYFDHFDEEEEGEEANEEDDEEDEEDEEHDPDIEELEDYEEEEEEAGGDDDYYEYDGYDDGDL